MEKKSWTANDITTILAAIFSGLALLISTWNQTKLDHVAKQQDLQVLTAAVIREDLATVQHATQEKLDRIDRSTATVESKVNRMP